MGTVLNLTNGNIIKIKENVPEENKRGQHYERRYNLMKARTTQSHVTLKDQYIIVSLTKGFQQSTK